MILLDAYAVLALARNEAAASEVEAVVRAHDVAVTATNYFEAADQLIRVTGWTPDETSERFALLFDRAVSVRAVDERVAWDGAVLRAGHYDRNTCSVSLADCILLASAGRDDIVATADPAVAAVARAEGIELIALPDSAGQLP